MQFYTYNTLFTNTETKLDIIINKHKALKAGYFEM